MSISVISRAFRRRVHAAAHIVARVQPRTSKGITDLLSLNLILLNTNCPIKQIVNLDELTYYQVTLHRRWRTSAERTRTHTPGCSPRKENGHGGEHGTPTPRPAGRRYQHLTADSVLFNLIESRSLSELTRQIIPRTKNGHAPLPLILRKSY